MLAWYKRPWAGHPHCYTDSIARESLKLGFGASIPEVAVHKDDHADETLEKSVNSTRDLEWQTYFNSPGDDGRCKPGALR